MSTSPKGITLTERECELLSASMEFMTNIPDIDWEKVAKKANYKDAKNARVMFDRLKKAKLSGRSAAESGDSTSKIIKARQNQKKAPSPRNAAYGGPKTLGKLLPKPTKELDSDDELGDADEVVAVKTEYNTPIKEEVEDTKSAPPQSVARSLQATVEDVKDDEE
ncbi:MAG: hypothetical protein M1827_003492 [Pycnora praestabilis]|nr:MAG: hypothetical protein M1827_003492 [Pycnora praestabilis]